MSLFSQNHPITRELPNNQKGTDHSGRNQQIKKVLFELIDKDILEKNYLLLPCWATAKTSSVDVKVQLDSVSNVSVELPDAEPRRTVNVDEGTDDNVGREAELPFTGGELKLKETIKHCQCNRMMGTRQRCKLDRLKYVFAFL